MNAQLVKIASQLAAISLAAACGVNNESAGNNNKTVDAGTRQRVDAAPYPDAYVGCPDDRFGVKEMYCTKPGGDEWFMDMNNLSIDTKRLDPPDGITKNTEDAQNPFYRSTASSVRLNIASLGGYDAKKITTTDQVKLASQLYMQSTADWKNVEMTGYVRVTKIDEEDNFGWLARGGIHSTDTDLRCQGTGYKGMLYYSGGSRISKYQRTDTQTISPLKAATLAAKLEDKWVGLKTVIFSVSNGVKIEVYADWDATNNWVKIDEKLDTTGFGQDGVCGGIDNQVITWGGPIATFSWDNADVDFKKLSIREIDPPHNL